MCTRELRQLMRDTLLGHLRSLVAHPSSCAAPRCRGTLQNLFRPSEGQTDAEYYNLLRNMDAVMEQLLARGDVYEDQVVVIDGVARPDLPRTPYTSGGSVQIRGQ